jgi:hypothetical protein
VGGDVQRSSADDAPGLLSLEKREHFEIPDFHSGRSVAEAVVDRRRVSAGNVLTGVSVRTTASCARRQPLFSPLGTSVTS